MKRQERREEIEIMKLFASIDNSTKVSECVAKATFIIWKKDENESTHQKKKIQEEDDLSAAKL